MFTQKRNLKTGMMILTLSFVSISCSKRFTSEESVANPLTAVVEAVANLVGGMADDQSSVGLAFRNEAPKSNLWQSLLGEKAYAEVCSRAFQASCVNGVQSVDYNSCTGPLGQLSFSGNITLTSSNLNCKLEADGDTVTRTANLTILEKRGAEIKVSSTDSEDYQGNTYGGGGKITKTSTGWDLEVLGDHRKISKDGKELMSVSSRSLAAAHVSGSLLRGNRTITGGQLEVNHNLAKFTAVMEPTDLKWNNLCCHPISGSMKITLSGSKTGTSTVKFNGCGSATVEENGESKAINLQRCQ